MNNYISSKISVVIPTHNREKFIVSAIESVMQQNYRNMEIIVVDDGSTDRTQEVLERFRDKVTYIYQESSGAGAARNTGINYAEGEYIAFLDSDDFWLPRKIEQQLALFQDPKIGMVGCGERCIDLSGNTLFESLGRGLITFDELIIRCANMPGGTSGLIVRRCCFDEVGLFDQTLARSQDWDLMLRIAQRYKVSSIEEPGVVRRVHRLPRPNASFETSLSCAQLVIRRYTQQSELRCIALAWTDYDYAKAYLGTGRWLKAFMLTSRSYFRYRGLIQGRRCSDLFKLAAEKFLTEKIYLQITGIYRKLVG